MDQATSTMANPSIQREQVYGEVQVLFLSSCPHNSLENMKYLWRRIKISRYLVTFHVPCWPRAAGHEWQTMIPGCGVKYELSFYLGSIVKDGNGVTVVTTINYHVEPKYLLELFSVCTHCSQDISIPGVVREQENGVIISRRVLLHINILGKYLTERMYHSYFEDMKNTLIHNCISSQIVSFIINHVCIYTFIYFKVLNFHNEMKNGIVVWMSRVSNIL